MQKDEAKEAKKKANEDNRKVKKKEAAQKKRDDAKAKAAEVYMFCFLAVHYCTSHSHYMLLTSRS